MLTLSDFPKIGRREGWNELWQVRPEIQTGAARAA